MTFKKNNQLWKKRSKSGRDVIFSDPAVLRAEAYKYFSMIDNNPLYEGDCMVVDKELTEFSRPKARPYTLAGLQVFLGVNDAYIRQFKADKNKCTPDFSTVISEIEQIIYTQKFELAAAGLLNANIISRELGLADKTNVQTVQYNADVTKEEAKLISDALENEF
jgi:hypothetical protein